MAQSNFNKNLHKIKHCQQNFLPTINKASRNPYELQKKKLQTDMVDFFLPKKNFSEICRLSVQNIRNGKKIKKTKIAYKKQINEEDQII